MITHLKILGVHHRLLRLELEGTTHFVLECETDDTLVYATIPTCFQFQLDHPALSWEPYFIAMFHSIWLNDVRNDPGEALDLFKKEQISGLMQQNPYTTARGVNRPALTDIGHQSVFTAKGVHYILPDNSFAEYFFSAETFCHLLVSLGMMELVPDSVYRLVKSSENKPLQEFALDLLADEQLAGAPVRLIRHLLQGMSLEVAAFQSVSFLEQQELPPFLGERLK